jgi:very-short-patch-repair endonuclease
MASLQAALKNAIQIQYQLEDSELAVEPLPNRDSRRLILIYESAEGGAGVLRNLLDEPQALSAVSRNALNLIHFDPETGVDLKRAPRARENCEAACYDCLMSYVNQLDHRLLDRHAIKDLLLSFSRANVKSSPIELPRSDHLDRLMRLAGSELEKKWLRYVEAKNYRLPSRAQVLLETCKTRPDFAYDESQTVIYIDGPHHEFPERHERDVSRGECMEDRGYTVIRFGHQDDWDSRIALYPHIFGREA